MSEMTKARNKNLTVPNALSVLRILVVPFFAWRFLAGDLYTAAGLLVFSGLSDLFDGMIARKFDQVTELGKMLDPFADKLTQGVVLICLLVRFPHIGLLLALFIVKEAFAAVTGLWGIRRARVVKGAEWHGKLTTVAIYTMILVHLIWADIPPAVSTILVGVCMGIMLMSLVLYAIRNIKMIRGKS